MRKNHFHMSDEQDWNHFTSHMNEIFKIRPNSKPERFPCSMQWKFQSAPNGVVILKCDFNYDFNTVEISKGETIEKVRIFKGDDLVRDGGQHRSGLDIL